MSGLSLHYNHVTGIYDTLQASQATLLSQVGGWMAFVAFWGIVGLLCLWVSAVCISALLRSGWHLE